MPARHGDRHPDLAGWVPSAGVQARGQNVGRVSLASIPSPHTGTIDLGPLTIHMYGLTLLVAIGVCTWVTGKR